MFHVSLQLPGKFLPVVLFQLLLNHPDHTRHFLILTPPQHRIHLLVREIASVQVHETLQRSVLLSILKPLLGLALFPLVCHLLDHVGEYVGGGA